LKGLRLELESFSMVLTTRLN